MGGNFIAETGKVLDKPGWVGHLQGSPISLETIMYHVLSNAPDFFRTEFNLHNNPMRNEFLKWRSLANYEDK